MTQVINQRIVASTIAAVGLILLGGCGSVDSSDGGSTADETTESTTDETTTTEEPATDTTTVTDDTATDTTTASDNADQLAAIADDLGGEVFDDPQGMYSMVIGSDWNDSGVDTEALDISETIEFWTLQPSADAFTSNLNLLDQPTGSDDLQAFIDLSLRTAPSSIADFELIDSGVIEGSVGQDLAVLTFTGQGLHFLSITAIANRQATTATLTAEPTVFEELRAEIEPFMLSMVLTP